MKKFVLLSFMLAMSLLSAGEWDLSKVSITLKDKPLPSQKMAKEELEKHLSLIAGKISPSEYFKVFVGVRPKGAPKAKKNESIWKIEKNQLWFYGDDGTEKKPKNGTLSAVYSFLHDQLKVVWQRPGDEWTVAPKAKLVKLPDSMTFRYIPELEMIAVRNYGWQRDTRWNGFVPDELKTSEETAKKRVEERGIWLNRMRHATRTKFRYGHAFRDWQKRFLATHPEYFGLNPYGKRGLPPAQEKLVKLCLSNPAVVDRIIADWKAKGTPKYLNVCPNDGTPGYCFCANCSKLDADLPEERFHSHKTDRYLYFCNKVAEKAVAIRPDVTIVTYIYSYYRFPPRREKIAYPDNMLFGLVPSMPDNLDEFFSGWAKAGVKHCFFRPNYLHYTGVLPRGLEKFFYDVFQTARKQGLMGVDYDTVLDRRPQELETYITARMVAEPERSFDELFNEYLSAYGAAAPAVKEYYLRVRARGEKALAATQKKMKKEKLDVLDDSHLGAYAVSGHTEKDLLKDIEVLKKGFSAKLSKQEKACLENLMLQLDHQLLTYRFLRAGQTGKGLENAAKNLMEFRIKNKEGIADHFGLIFSREEGPNWKNVAFYQKEVAKSNANPLDLSTGWRSSFDRPDLDSWKSRELFVKITDRTASFDKYSVELATGKKQGFGIWRNGVAVTPGAKYSLIADFKFAPKAPAAGIRVAANGKTIARLSIKPKDEYWQTGSVEFSVPAKTDKIVLYIYVEAGEIPSSIYVDNINLKRL